MNNDRNNLRMMLREALDNMWSRIRSLFVGLEDRVTALEQGGGGGGGDVNVIESISVNGTNIQPDANKNVNLTVPKVKVIGYTPTADLTANSYGYFSIPAPDDIKNKEYLATSTSLGHPAASSGLQLTGLYAGGDYLYLSYYTPKAILANNADVVIRVVYFDK